MEDLLQVGVITSTHGIQGEVKVFPTTDDTKRFKKLRECFIESRGEMIPVKAIGCKFFKNMVILKFENMDDVNDIEKYKQCRLYVDREHAVKLEADEYFVTDLIGLKVVRENGDLFGTLKEVIPTGANDVYVITDEADREWLLPAIKDCILDVNMEAGQMVVRLLKGMEE